MGSILLVLCLTLGAFYWYPFLCPLLRIPLVLVLYIYYWQVVVACLNLCLINFGVPAGSGMKGDVLVLPLYQFSIHPCNKIGVIALWRTFGESFLCEYIGQTSLRCFNLWCFELQSSMIFYPGCHSTIKWLLSTWSTTLKYLTFIDCNFYCLTVSFTML